jgi:hypothetical protein
MRVLAVRTPSDAATVAGAFIYAYERMLHRSPVHQEEWLYPLAQSAFETGHWKSMYNNNVGNLEFGGDTFSLGSAAPGPFTSYATMADSAEAMLRWLAKKNALTHAFHADLPAYMDAVQAGNYAGKNADYATYRNAMASLVEQYRSTVPKPYEPESPLATTSIYRPFILAGAAVAGAAGAWWLLRQKPIRRMIRA